MIIFILLGSNPICSSEKKHCKLEGLFNFYSRFRQQKTDYQLTYSTFSSFSSLKDVQVRSTKVRNEQQSSFSSIVQFTDFVQRNWYFLCESFFCDTWHRRDDDLRHFTILCSIWISNHTIWEKYDSRLQLTLECGKLGICWWNIPAV